MDDTDFSAVIEDFFNSSGKGKSTAVKFSPLLPVSIGFLQSLGVGFDDIPTETQLALLEENLRTVKNRRGTTYSDSTIHDWIRITNDFFTYRAGQNNHEPPPKGEQQMTIPDTEEFTPVTPAFNAGYRTYEDYLPEPPQPDEEGTETVSDPQQHEEDTATAPEDEKRKPGRPIKGNEGRDKKITVNIPTSIFNDIKDMANIDNVTFPDCVNTILENAVNDRWDDIQAIRALRARRH